MSSMKSVITSYSIHYTKLYELLYALAGSVLVHTARSAGLTVIQEAFADRAYRADGTLVPRSEPGAVLTSEEAVSRQLREIVAGSATSLDGVRVPIHADTLCLHSVITSYSIHYTKLYDDLAIPIFCG